MYPTRLTSELSTYASVSTKGWWSLTAATQLSLSDYSVLRLLVTLLRWRTRVHIFTISIHHYGSSPISLRESHPQNSRLSCAFQSIHFHLSINYTGNPVLYHGHSYSNRSFITLQGCTSSHTLSPLTTMYTSCISATFKRKPGEGVGHDLTNHHYKKIHFCDDTYLSQQFVFFVMHVHP